MIVTMKGVHKSFGSTEVLKGIDLEVGQGEVVAIIGASGSGKSTILRIANNLETVSKGEVWVCDVPVHDARQAHKVHGRVGMVFQQFNLFPHLDAAENVMLALKRVKKMSKAEAESVAKEVLGKVGMADHWSKYPIQLSGGQQQRVAIARSLALEPRLMLFDEATSALDPELVGEVTSVMRQLAKDGMSMMIVTHEMRFAREIADRVLFIDQGVIVEHGPPSAVFGSPQNARTQRFLSSVFNI